MSYTVETLEIGGMIVEMQNERSWWIVRRRQCGPWIGTICIRGDRYVCFDHGVALYSAATLREATLAHSLRIDV